jgi:hypothetical protein
VLRSANTGFDERCNSWLMWTKIYATRGQGQIVMS